MRLLADLHISPRTAQFLRSVGHDIVRVNEILPGNSTDDTVVKRAAEDARAILTQDLDYSAIIVLSGARTPSLISLRLSSSRVEYVNTVLEKVLPQLEQDVLSGMMITVEDSRIRRRSLPVS